ncbi:death-associated protein kinase 1-like isoform X3 [Pecten maximus]|uniref:death-associated protein kinase 1-like isoform X3 n=1 Tax=Pecten maximus TaxID=6579 RepID=UPI00145872F4|nr:death-associated protein kinase 1-like isoform X3 [Pecten maximus]XP_033750475.1 death-associated protein kinase 1-like isoform X3 [Pecten maximus]
MKILNSFEMASDINEDDGKTCKNDDVPGEGSTGLDRYHGNDNLVSDRNICYLQEEDDSHLCDDIQDGNSLLKRFSGNTNLDSNYLDDSCCDSVCLEDGHCECDADGGDSTCTVENHASSDHRNYSDGGFYNHGDCCHENSDCKEKCFCSNQRWEITDSPIKDFTKVVFKSSSTQPQQLDSDRENDDQSELGQAKPDVNFRLETNNGFPSNQLETNNGCPGNQKEMDSNIHGNQQEMDTSFHGDQLDIDDESYQSDGNSVDGFLGDQRSREGYHGDGDSCVSTEDFTISNVFEEKAENFVMAALFCASEEGNVEGLKELVGMAQNIDLTAANRHGETAVHMAASGGHTEVLKFLQAKGVDISIQDKNGDSAVYWAARQGHLDVLRHLKDENVPLDSQNKSGESALHVAARYGHAAVVDFLCSAGSNVNLQDNLGETALHSASWHGFLRIVTSLCSSGAKIDADNKEGETALHNASARGYLDVVKILLDYGAPVNQMDKRGGTALYLACNRRHSNIAMVLLHAGCEMDIIDKESGECALHCAAREGLSAVVQTMCAFGCQVDIISQDGFTPLHLSCKHGHTEIVRCLLLSGARPEITNKDGVTSEIMALAQGFTDIAELVNKVKRDRAGNFVTQLIPSSQPLSRIKLKLLGSTGVGKSTLVETLKCGLFSGLFRRSRLTSQASTDSHKGRPRLPRQYSLPTPLCYSVSNPIYTKGINVQQVSISGIGDVSVWDFSGYEPYYMLYDHFLGDSNCIHIIVFSLTDTYDEQIAQVHFWLGVLKSRVPPHVPIGHCGRLPNTPKVILVATHADKVGCHKNARGEYVCPTASRVLAKAQLKFASDINFVERVFVMDANVAMSNDVKALKQQIGDMRTQIIGELPRSNGFLDAMVAQLPSWRRSSSSFPVLSWTQFVEYVRAKINPLAGDDHMKILVEELQLIGEIVYLECDTSQDLVILHPKWLSEDIIGNLISQEKIIQSRITGCFTVDDFQLMYPETDALDLLQVLEALEVCTQCDNEGEIEYEFPCLNFIETLNGLWQKDSKRFGSAVYGGVRIQTDPELGGQLKHIFARIQVSLRHNVLQESEDPDAELYQWHHGSKYCCGEMEGILGMDRHEQHLEIKVRGPADRQTQLFYFLEDFMHVVEQTALSVCPGLCLERHLSSCLNLKNHSKTVHAFSPLHIMRAQRNKSNCVQLPDGRTEDLADLMFLGSLEVVQNVTLGIDLPISHLTVHTRRILSNMLDPPEPMGRDWCLLAVTLGLQNLLPGLDNSSTPVSSSESKTDRVLLEWSKEAPQCTIGQLVSKLLEFNREDVVEMVLRTSPLFKVMMYEDHSTDDSTIPPPTTASTNTLSNLSR